MEVLKVTNLSKSFSHSGEDLAVLQELSLEVRKHQIVGIVGPTGCGKTTLLRIIAGLDTQTSGTVEFTGQTEHRNQIGLLFQAPTLLPWRNVFENIRLPLGIEEHQDSHLVERTISDVIESVGLKGFENYSPSKISGGMQARTALARALVLRPPLLCLDEPFASIDAITRFTLCGLLIRVLKEFGSSVVLVTHSLDEAVLLSDRVIVLSARPATIIGIVDIEMPKEERLQEPEHLSLVSAKKQVRQFLAQKVIERVTP